MSDSMDKPTTMSSLTSIWKAVQSLQRCAAAVMLPHQHGDMLPITQQQAQLARQQSTTGQDVLSDMGECLDCKFHKDACAPHRGQ